MKPPETPEPPDGKGWRNAKDVAAIARGYDTMMSKVYDFLTCWFLAPLIREAHLTLLRHLAPAGREGLLDVGCGTGTMMAMAGKRSPSGIMVGLDSSLGMLERASRKLAQSDPENLSELVLADAEALPFRGSSFGTCTSAGTLRFIPDPALAIREAFRVLREGGMLGLREMAGGQTPRLIRHIPLPFKASFVVWRLLPDRWVEAFLRSAGFDDVASFRRGLVPQFIIAMGPPFRKYVFFIARRPVLMADPPRVEGAVMPQMGRRGTALRCVTGEVFLHHDSAQ